ncbi:hypothetical protein PVAP13_6NG057649 [Panicum virgatum]|uniref:Uncharacterized protein n=1 Tax=Panicum virgatum TaxID=38727 RepID=A0A8T0QUF1_PANVG|nr:hypothetical protein PVAP13_6NG057649 [Panicum virgatum]
MYYTLHSLFPFPFHSLHVHLCSLFLLFCFSTGTENSRIWLRSKLGIRHKAF